MRFHTIVAVMLFELVAVAQAAPPPDLPFDPEMHQWFSSLKQPNTGISCCSIADCRPYDSQMSGDHYEIRIHGQWWPVPNNVVLHRENITGSAIACIRNQWNWDNAPAPS